MVAFGYTSCASSAARASSCATPSRPSSAGFDFEVISDHYFPWLEEQGHAPYAWSVLGAVAHGHRARSS